MKKSEALQQRKELIKLIIEQTEAAILARYGRFEDLEYLKHKLEREEKEYEVRQLLFGESDLYKLGLKWSLFPKTRKQKNKTNPLNPKV